uniref:Uncharacterized protein n=1 Tax=Anguilla anguilla TaxID=7936 RepID=A0A0E9UVM4_ANGAN
MPVMLVAAADCCPDRPLASAAALLAANSCRNARANARPTTCAPITTICARYLAMACPSSDRQDYPSKYFS